MVQLLFGAGMPVALAAVQSSIDLRHSGLPSAEIAAAVAYIATSTAVHSGKYPPEGTEGRQQPISGKYPPEGRQQPIVCTGGGNDMVGGVLTPVVLTSQSAALPNPGLSGALSGAIEGAMAAHLPRDMPSSDCGLVANELATLLSHGPEARDFLLLLLREVRSASASASASGIVDRRS